MDGIREWAFSLCAAMTACGLAQMLLPKSGMEKIFRTTVSVFILCSLLSPLVLRAPDLRIEWEAYAQSDIQQRADRLTDSVQREAEGAAEAELGKIIEEKLAQMGINHGGVTIHITTDGQRDWESGVPRATLRLDEAHSGEEARIRRELEEGFGIGVDVVYSKAAEKGG